MHKRQNYIYVGLDIHKETHTAIILNCWEEELGSLTFANRPSEYHQLRKLVNQKKGNCQVIYGLEGVHHYGRDLSLYLLDKKEIVKEVNSALSYMERMSYSMTKKDDLWDAKCVASVLIRRCNDLPDAEPNDLYWTMKMILRRRNALVGSFKQLTNQLHGQLKDHYPSYKKFFHDITCKTALAFFQAYPSPRHLENVTLEELRRFLIDVSHRSCSTRKASYIFELIKEDEAITKDHQTSRDFIVKSIVRDIEFKKEELTRIEQEMRELRALFPCPLETIPGLGEITAFSLIACIGDINRFSHSSKLARYAGIAPNHYSSAGKGIDKQSKQGNRILYNILYFLAVGQVQKKGDHMRNPICRAYFEKKVSEGKTKIQALLCVMRKLINIIYRMMKYNEPYKISQNQEIA